MSQPVDISKIRELYRYHVELIDQWRKGRLEEGKINVLLEKRAAAIGVGIATYKRRKGEVVHGQASS